MKTILVPVDFSEPSENALKIAAGLARKTRAKIMVLHVMEIAEPLMGTGQYYVEDQKMVFFMKLAQEKFARFLNKPYLQELEITDLIEVGSTTHGITHVVEKYDAEMIVMGSKGYSGAEEVLIGSNTEKVVRNSQVPVLVIKNELKTLQIRKMLFACDFERENFSAYQKAKKFAADFNAEMQLLYVNTPGDKFQSSMEIKEKIRRFLGLAETAFHFDNITFYDDYTVEYGVLNAAQDLQADLIAMPTHGRKGLAHFFTGSIAEDVTHHSTIPVVTFRLNH